MKSASCVWNPESGWSWAGMHSSVLLCRASWKATGNQENMKNYFVVQILQFLRRLRISELTIHKHLSANLFFVVLRSYKDSARSYPITFYKAEAYRESISHSQFQSSLTNSTCLLLISLFICLYFQAEPKSNSLIVRTKLANEADSGVYNYDDRTEKAFFQESLLNNSSACCLGV